MPSPRVAAGVVVGDDYKVVRPLSEREASSVYLAEQVSTGASRALKLLDPRLVLDPAVRARFEKEVRVGAQIESDHVALVVGAGVDASTGAPFVAMEYLDGDDLAGRVAARHGLAPSEVIPIFDDVCDALGAAHDVGVAHGGLSPQNVILGRPGGKTTKVVDFGLAKLRKEAKVEATEAPVWTAPEQLGPAAPSAPSPAGDVWTLGLLAFYALTERAYFRAANAARPSRAELALEITQEPLEKASERARALGSAAALSAAFDAWFAKCVARDPSARYEDARAAHAGLVKALSEAPAAKPKAKFAAKGTLVLGDGPAPGVPGLGDAPPPARAPEPAPAVAFGDEPTPVFAGAAALAQATDAADAPAVEQPKKKTKVKKEMTMTVGLGVAPGFSSEEIIARDLGRAPAKKTAAATLEPDAEPLPGFAAQASTSPRPYEDLPAPPIIPMPRAARADAALAPIREDTGGTGRVVLWGVVAVLVAGGAAFAGVKYLARPVSGPDANSTTTTTTTTAGQTPIPPAASTATVIPPSTSTVPAASAAPADAMKGSDMAQQTPVVSFDATTFTMGSTQGAPNEQPPHAVQVAAFALDAREVTQQSYDACVTAGKCTAPSKGDDCNVGRPDRASHPANCVDHDQAASYCAWVGGRLPSEAEWEYAAGGKKGAPMRRYPWGDALPDQQLCWNRCGGGNGGTCAAGSYPQGNTPTGLSDMAGNVAEWTDTPFCLYAQPGCKGDDGVVVRGGAFCGSDASAVRAAARQAQPPAAASARIGFRCARASK